MLWLIGIVVLPLATVLDVYARRDDRLAIGIYVGMMIFVMSLARLEELILYRAKLLTERLTTVDLAARWISVAIVCLALVIALCVPHIGLWSLLLWIVAAPIENAVERWWNRRRAV
jgi:hypothetical protein